jgi:hypothetical protein
MNYVLAGSTYLAVFGVREALFGPCEPLQPIAGMLRSWLPFALGIAITAAIAPLVFLQIVYRREFYTANLLLFNRWMSILPVLIVAFYLLYLQKSERWYSWPAAARAAISLGILGCFAFVAWSWTENHLLSLRDESVWADHYVSNDWFYYDPEQFPRLAVWYVGAFPTLAMALAGQFLLYRKVGGKVDARTARTLALVALSGLFGSALAVLGYFLVLPNEVLKSMMPDGRTFAVVAVAGFLLEGAAWARVWSNKSLTSGLWWATAGGVVVATAAAAYLRELRRVAALDLSRGAEIHAAAARVGGEGLFLFYLAANTLVIVGLIILIRRGVRPANIAE